ncbi:hypothetical protein DRP77_13540, partial [Candidatus Poribacteria bacterium]
GTSLHTEDGGRTWEKQYSGVKNSLKAVYFLNENVGWVVGGEGTILATRDGGRRWAKRFSGTKYNLNAIHFPDPKHGWIVGDNGIILRFVSK